MKRLMPLLMALLFAGMSAADMGSIPFKPTAKVLEPNQRALIACNGKEQILILTTDLQADQETKVLEIMPCPSEPTVTKADADVFKRATDMINRKLPRTSGGFMSLGEASFGSEEAAPAGTVTFHQRIGAHDVSTTHVENPASFVQWAQDYLKTQGVDNPTIPPALAGVIGEYIKENFKWFVFDVVSLSNEPVTKEALQFRFKTEFLFYPMRITRAEHGDTTVTLLILTPRLIDPKLCLGLNRDRIRMVHQPVTLTGAEVASLSKDIFGLLGSPETIQIRSWEIKGRLDSFDDDVIVGDPATFINHLRGRQQQGGGYSPPAARPSKPTP